MTDKGDDAEFGKTLATGIVVLVILALLATLAGCADREHHCQEGAPCSRPMTQEEPRPDPHGARVWELPREGHDVEVHEFQDGWGRRCTALVYPGRGVALDCVGVVQ